MNSPRVLKHIKLPFTFVLSLHPLACLLCYVDISLESPFTTILGICFTSPLYWIVNLLDPISCAFVISSFILLEQKLQCFHKTSFLTAGLSENFLILQSLPFKIDNLVACKILD